ncbi:MAG: alkaline phytoceramidase [Acidobacteria bacterium]|nr:MAG: alkaline phytoceramidase [Acidobacteriota bacterium]
MNLPLRNVSLRTRVLIVLGVAVFCAFGLALVKPIPQPLSYHYFADQRQLCGIPNAGNTVSNLPFLFVGVWGIIVILRGRARFIDARERWFYLIFFAGVALTCIGSAYYHLAPNNDRLVWDRLPITLSFMSLLAAMVAERVNLKAGLAVLAPLLLLGIASVWYWHLTEQWGRGDLRMYGFVQFFPALGIPLMMWLFPARYTRSFDLLPAVGFYVLAKVLEAADKRIYALGEAISGHTLKHLAAAMATVWILRMLVRRKPVRA